jgi:hypothetical protein
MGVEHLKRAQDTKNDEFYTQHCDIERESRYRQNDFVNRVIWCPCDNYKTSNFVKYFKDNFHKLGLRALIATCIKNETISQDASFYIYDGVNERVEQLTDGSFESSEVIEHVFPYIDGKNTVVATNPPFSKIRSFIPYMLSIDNHAMFDLLVIMPPNVVCYIAVFPLIKSEKLRVSYNHKVRQFIQVDGSIKELSNCYFFTTLPVNSEYMDTWKDNSDVPFKSSNCIQCLSPHIVYGDKEYPVYNFDRSNDVVVPDSEVCFISIPISYITKKVPKNLKLFDFSNKVCIHDSNGDVKNIYKRLLFAANVTDTENIKIIDKKKSSLI